jgi:DNA-binding NarL/FixJ family response regulator
LSLNIWECTRCFKFKLLNQGFFLMTEKIKILVVDDHTIVRQGICRELQTIESFEIVGEADCGHEAVNLIFEHCPDIVIMDITMPGLNGIETTKLIREINSNIKIIALSMHSKKIYVMEMLNSGASAYLLKTCAFNELHRSINIVLSGEIYLCPEIAKLVRNGSRNSIQGQKSTPMSILTPREKEVLQLIAEGYQTKDIAQKLKISTKTVDVHRAKLNKKLDIHNIAQLTRFAIAQNLTPLDL